MTGLEAVGTGGRPVFETGGFTPTAGVAVGFGFAATGGGPFFPATLGGRESEAVIISFFHGALDPLEGVIPGNTAAVQEDKPFRGLGKYVLTAL